MLSQWRWILTFSICIPCWFSFSTSASSNTNSPLWRQEFQHTGESRGGNKSPRSSRRQRERSTLFKGGATSSASTSPQQQENDPQIPEQLFQFRKKLGKFMIDLGESKAIREQEATIAPSNRTRRVLRLSLLPNSNNATISNTTGQIFAVKQQKANLQGNPIEMSLSIDAFSAFRLLQNFGGASIGTFAAFLATLRMLAPMIAARRCLAFLAYIGVDHYNGRYLRQTYNKRMEYIHKHEIPSGLRAVGRAAIQLLGMSIIGRLSMVILEASPCLMPNRVCKYWFGMVWTLSVIAAARITEIWMTSQIPLLEIQPAANYRTKASPLRIFMRPWHILQWMRDPEESIRKVLKFGNRDGPLPFQADSLLFPSTWPPLQLLTIVAMIHVIQRTLPSPPRALLRNFCIQRVLYEEWFRILFKERRVALGAVVSVLSFLAKVRLVHSTFTVDGVAGVLLTPAILASLVAGWMNVVLCNERIVARKKRAAAVTPTIRGPAIYASDNLDSQWDGEHIWDTNG